MQSSNKSETHCYGIIANIEKSLNEIYQTHWLTNDGYRGSALQKNVCFPLTLRKMT